MLTQRQHDLLGFLIRQARVGVCPSFEEMSIAMGLRSKSGIHRTLGELEERGFISRLPRRKRAIEVIHRPSGGDMAQSFVSLKKALEAMARRKAALIQENSREPRWFVTYCGEVSADTAATIRDRPDVRGEPDAMFPGMHQTWRMAHWIDRASP